MTSDSTETPDVHPGPSKGLLRLVKVLGLVMVLLFLALIGGIIWKATNKPKPAVPMPVTLDFTGADVQHIALDGKNLAITSAHEIIVIDIATGKAVLRLPLK